MLGTHLPTMVTSVNMSPLAPEIIGKAYWRYEGSLTTPPCAEDVVWTVVKEVRSNYPCKKCPQVPLHPIFKTRTLLSRDVPLAGENCERGAIQKVQDSIPGKFLLIA